MSSGRRHDSISITLSAAIALAVAAVVGVYYAGIFAGGYTAGWRYLSPDLDLPQSLPSRRWGKCLKKIWEPYQATHKHRGTSHWPLIGSAVRLTYLFFCGSPLIVVGLIAADSLSGGALVLSVAVIAPAVFAFYCGVEAACLLHLALDTKALSRH